MTTTEASALPWRREGLIALTLLIAGLSLVPVAIWFVGRGVFGGCDGDGFGGFYAELLARLGDPSLVAWFLVLSPLLGVVTIRLTIAAFKLAKRSGRH